MVTKPVFQQAGPHILELRTKITSIKSISELPETEQALFKGPSSDNFSVVETEETIFYPQGGGQPSDVGTFSSVDGGAEFEVIIVRNSHDKEHILHFGTFPGHKNTFSVHQEIIQKIDTDKRLLYSRIHTAGHVLGLAVAELGNLITDVVDTKAQHYPDAAYVEFRGSIDGRHQNAIQVKTDELVEKNFPVTLHWWEMSELHEKCAAVLDGFTLPEGEKARVVEVETVGAYPCGGTHVAGTKDVGKIIVGKIKRSKGMTKISYSVADV